MNKICTDINQSKKLVELGIDVNTADMWYQHIGYSIIDGKEKPTYFPMVIRDNISDDDIPAWSLAALLDVINKNYYTTLYHDGVAWNIDIIHHDNDKEKHNVYANTPIDACVEMIIELHEQKLL